MKAWLFGKEIPYFKPLRHELSDSVFEKIELSDKLIELGWDKEEMIELIKKKGFLDPNYENYIRTADHLINIQHYVVENIDSIHNPTNSVDERIPVFYKEFIKDNELKITHEFEEKGVLSLWVTEDLSVEGKFKKKEGDHYYFTTKYFIYSINKDYELISVYYINTNEEVSEITWTESGFTIRTVLGNDYFKQDDYAEWLSFIIHYSNYTWSINEKLPSRVDNLINNLNMKWVIHPLVWKSLQVDTVEEKEFFIKLFKKDWETNAFIVKSIDKICEMSGWRFHYIWDGFILRDILTPDKKKIQSISISEEYLILNDSTKTDLTQDSPRKVTDLVEGNIVKMLPANSLKHLELHPHAIQRYEQRIDDKSYLCTMLDDIKFQVYNYGQIVGGAHTDERRKVETSRYGYVLSDNLVISVWDKHNHRLKRRNKRKSSKYKRLEKMTKLFSQIEEGKL